MQANRKALYGAIHSGAYRLLQLNTMLRKDADRTYRDWLQGKTGQRSCKNCTDAQLTSLKRFLIQKGALNQANPKTGKSHYLSGRGKNRPTQSQQKKLMALALDRNWDGIECPQMQGFIKRTTGVENLRFLTRKQMSDVISGLEKWNKDL